MEKNLLLIMVIMLEEIQSKTVVCVQFFLWNILDLLRYAHHLLLFISRHPFLFELLATDGKMQLSGLTQTQVLL